MATSIPSGEYDAVLSHLFDASQDAVPARFQVISYEIDGLHGRLFTPGNGDNAPLTNHSVLTIRPLSHNSQAPSNARVTPTLYLAEARIPRRAPRLLMT